MFLSFYLLSCLAVFSLQPHKHWSFWRDYLHYFTARKLNHKGVKQHPRSPRRPVKGRNQELNRVCNVLSSHKYSSHPKFHSQCLCKYLCRIKLTHRKWARLLFRNSEDEFVTKMFISRLNKYVAKTDIQLWKIHTETLGESSSEVLRK